MARKKKQAVLGEAERSRYEKYEIVEIERSALNNAPYNPRMISDKAKKALRKNIKEVGLMGPVIWNRRTGNIVAGHQRISSLDALEGSPNYKLKVAAVDVDEKTEKEQNIFMNNTEAQGDFDLEGLEAMIKDPSLNFENMGFDRADIYQLFGQDAMPDEDVAEMSNKLHEMKDVFDKMERRMVEKESPDFYLVVVFKGYNERKEFTDSLKLPDNRYVDGKRLADLVQPAGAVIGSGVNS